MLDEQGYILFPALWLHQYTGKHLQNSRVATFQECWLFVKIHQRNPRPSADCPLLFLINAAEYLCALLENKTKTSYRRAFANHYMSAESMLPWGNDGRFPPTKDMRGAP